jgi:hypothetical protein
LGFLLNIGIKCLFQEIDMAMIYQVAVIVYLKEQNYIRFMVQKYASLNIDV